MAHKILIVDDSVTMRRAITEAIKINADFDVVGVAANGKIALQMIPQLLPDLITLDVEMPVMNGLETLEELRKRFPRLPVIMVSALTHQGAAATIDALTRGANDYIQKPVAAGSFEATIQGFREQLIPKLLALCQTRENRINRAASALRPPPASLPSARRTAPPTRVDVVAIGVSTGGPNALTDIMPHFPADFPVPMLIVQHMPPMFTKLLADRLKLKSRLNVQEATAGAVLKPGDVWIAPGDFHMVLERKAAHIEIVLNKDPHENSCRPAVDPLFRSVAGVYGGHCLTAVLTGMGQDGLHGCEEVAKVGGQIVAQDEASSVVWGMPGFVANAGLADKVLPLDQLPGEIMRRVDLGRNRLAA